MKRGKFIVIYGVNNLGKSTQIKLLIEKLKAVGVPVEYLKYAVYSLEPSGCIINDYLRNGNPYNLTPREFQLMQALDGGTWVIAEDYASSAMMWGMAAGIDRDYLIRTNNHLLQPDLAFLFHGERFIESVEAGHIHEQNDGLTDRAAMACNELAELFQWNKICANQEIADVAKDVWKEIVPLLSQDSS